jgi:prefoldin subunit 5
LDSAANCATRLRALGADPRFAPCAEDLESIADELADDDLDSWVGMDLVGAFPPESSIVLEPASRDRVQRGLAAFVALLVFTPVAWTWFSLHKASQAYSDMVESGDPIKDTFLTLWITGFGGRLGELHRLVDVSLVSFALIMLAAMTVVLHRVATTAAEREIESRALGASTTLVRELRTAQRVLDARRSDDPARIEAVVKRSVKELLSAHKATQSTVETLRESADSVTTTLDALTTAASDTRGVAVAATDAAKRLAQSSASLVQEIDATLSRFDSAIDAHLTGLRTETSAVVVQAGEASQKVASLVSEAVDQLRVSEQHVTRNLDDLKQGIQQLDGALRRHESAMQGQASELTDARDAMERMLRALMQSGASSVAQA